MASLDEMKKVYSSFFAMAETEGIGTGKIYGFWTALFLIIPLLPFSLVYIENTLINIILILYALGNLIFIIAGINHINKYFAFDINPFDYVKLQFSLVVYTIVVFGLAYFVFYKINKSNFGGNISDANIIDFIYYSFVTISTLGYGDVFPNTIYIKILVVVELIFGAWFVLAIVPGAISLQANRLLDLNKKRREYLKNLQEGIDNGDFEIIYKGQQEKPKK